jgi:hypothetical protein
MRNIMIKLAHTGVSPDPLHPNPAPDPPPAPEPGPFPPEPFPPPVPPQPLRPPIPQLNLFRDDSHLSQSGRDEG